MAERRRLGCVGASQKLNVANCRSVMQGYRVSVWGIVLVAGLLGTGWAQNVGIGTTHPHPTALVEMQDTSRGMLIPRLTTVQRDAIDSPAHGLIILNIDSFCLEIYDTVSGRWYPISCPRRCLVPRCVPHLQGALYVCAGDTVVYTVEGCPLVELEWVVPSGWTIVSGQGTDTLVVVADTTDGQVAVRACNACGCGRRSVLSVVADSCQLFCLAVGGGNDDYGRAVIPTADGGYAIAGWTYSFGQGNREAYILKMDAFGNLQWTRTVGGTNDDGARTIIQTMDGGYLVVGGTQSFGQGSWDVFVVKLDANGNVQWTRTIGGSFSDGGFGVVQTVDGGYVIGGRTFSFGQGGWDVYVIRLDAMGNVQWTRTVGGAGNEEGIAIVQTMDGGFAIAGLTSSFGNGSYDMYLVKLDAMGNLQWTRTIGGSGWDGAWSVVQTKDGGYALAGVTSSFGSGASDVYVAKLDGNGNLQWAKAIGGPADDGGRMIVQTTDGGYAVVGITRSFGQGGWDVYVVKLDGNGNLQWTRTIGGSSDDLGRAILQTGDGRYMVVGWTRSFGQGNLDVYVLRLDALGNVQSCPGGCQVGMGGWVVSGGGIGAGGSSGSGGQVGTGGVVGSGGIVTQICP